MTPILYYVCRKNTSERVVDHASAPILVLDKELDAAKVRFANVLRCHPEDLEGVTVEDYMMRYVIPVDDAYARARKAAGRIS